jgi:hypothetical protein
LYCCIGPSTKPNNDIKVLSATPNISIPIFFCTFTYLVVLMFYPFFRIYLFAKSVRRIFFQIFCLFLISPQPSTVLS